MGAIIYEDVARYLDAQGAVEFDGAGRNVWGGNMPARPDFMIGVYEHSGFEPTRTMGRRVIDEVTVQIIVRDVITTVARAKAWEIYSVLSDFNVGSEAERTIDGTVYGSILARHPPFPLGQDENNRFRWTCSYIVRRFV